MPTFLLSILPCLPGQSGEVSPHPIPFALHWQVVISLGNVQQSGFVQKQRAIVTPGSVSIGKSKGLSPG